MNQDYEALGKRIGSSIVIGSIIIALSIMLSSEVGFHLLLDILKAIGSPQGIILLIVIVASLLGTSLAIVANKNKNIQNR